MCILEDDDPRILWIVKQVCILLLQDKNWKSAEIICPLKPKQNPKNILLRFLNSSPQNSTIFFFSPSLAKVEDDLQDGSSYSEIPLSDPPTAMGSIQWEASIESEDVISEVYKAGPLLHFIEGLPREELGLQGIIVRKAISGCIEGSNAEKNLEDTLPLCLQLTYIHNQYRESLQLLFKFVYLPVIERLSKNDPTGYLKLLADGLVRISNINEGDAPFEVMPSVEPKKHHKKRFNGKSFASMEEDAEEGEEGDVPVRDPREFLLRNINNAKEKYMKEEGEGTLTDLRTNWETSYCQLSNALSYSLSHPVITNLGEEKEKAEAIKRRKKRGRRKFKKKVKFEEKEIEEDDVSQEDQGDSQEEATVAQESQESQEDEKDEDERNETSGAIAKKKKKNKKPKVSSESEEVNEKLMESLSSLSRLHSQLTDCQRSLFYLEDCFKVVEAGKVDELGGKSWDLMKTLEIVWRVGRRDGISGRIQILLEASIQSLVDVVTGELRPVNLLPSSLKELQPLLNAQLRVNKAEGVVTEWEKSVSSLSARIWMSDKRQKDGRHDFDPRKVVGTIQDLKGICEDLQTILKELLEVQVVMSAEWSSLVTTKYLENLKVIANQVLKVLIAYDFNIFSPRNKDRWTRQKDDFKRCVVEWEQAAKQAIKDSFEDRLTSELVSAVASVLRKDPCRPIFRDLLLSHLPSLMSAFALEVDGIKDDFEKQRERPQPGCQAPVAGKVRWMDAYLKKRLAAWSVLKELYVKHKDDSASLQQVNEIGERVEDVRKEVEKARISEVNQWRAEVSREIPKLLVTPVLSKQDGCEGDKGWGVKLPGALQTIVWESGQLIQGGFQPPPLALHFSLHYPSLQMSAMRLHMTLKDFNFILESLSPIQKDVLKGELDGTERVLEAGRRVVTWSPASLTHFSKSCKTVIDHVTGIATKLMNITKRLNDLVKMISETNLMSFAKPSSAGAKRSELPLFQELLKTCESNRDDQLKHLQDLYERLVFTLRSTSSLLASSSETSPEILQPHLLTCPDILTRITPFINHWKENVQQGINDMIINTLTRLRKSMMGEAVGLFQVGADLTSSGALCLTTPARHLVAALSLSLGKVVRCAMIFRHWRTDENGSVLLDNKTAMDEDTLAASSFYNQVSKDKSIHEAIIETQNCFADVIKTADMELQRWYSFEHVWHRDKEATVNKFTTTSATVRQYDDKLRFYKELIENLQESKQYTVCHCIRLNLELLIVRINHHANLWIRLIGAKLKDVAEKRLDKVRQQINKLEENLQVRVHDFVSLRLVVLASRNVTSNYSNFTTDLQEIQVMFHILQAYGLPVNEAFITQTEEISEKVENLFPSSSKAMKNSFEIYLNFKEKTLKKLENFLKKVDEFYERYHSSGPGSVGKDLETGLDLLKKYSKEFQEINEERDSLDKDVDIFDLPEIQCKPIDVIKINMEILSGVYEVYRKLRAVEYSWRSLRFATVSLEELEKELSEVEQTLLLREDLLETDIGEELRKKLEKHLLSLKVVATLRQPAVQQRHWDYLTNITIDTSESVTSREGSFMSVAEVLQMNLSDHAELVGKCVMAARKENRILQQIEEIKEFWLSAQVELDMTGQLWTLEGTDYLMEALRHHHLILCVLGTSKFSVPCSSEIKSLSGILLIVDQLLKKWEQLHSHLKIVLSQPISSQLPLAEGMLAKYRQILESTQRRPYVSELASKDEYLQKLDSILQESSDMIEGLTGVLQIHRDLCHRLYFLSDSQLALLLSSQQPIQYFEKVLHQVFNNISSLTCKNDEVTGLVSDENEILYLTKPVKVVKGQKVTNGISNLVDEIKKSTKSSFERILLSLKEEGTLTGTMLNSSVVSQVETGWLVWWTADVEEAYKLIESGRRYALRDVLSRATENIKTVLNAMGRLIQSFSDKKSLKLDRSLSESRKTWSVSGGLQDSSSERGQDGFGYSGISSSSESSVRLQSLLLTLLRCRDVVALLLKQNSQDADSFYWRIQPRHYLGENNSLLISVMHRQLKYGFEYRGSGSHEFVLTPNCESALITLLSAVASHKPALLVGENSMGGTGRQSLGEFGAHLAGKFLINHKLNSETSLRSLRKLIKGCLLEGCYLMLRTPELGPIDSVSFISSIIFKVLNAHAHPHSPGIVQLGNEDIKINPGVGFILIPASSYSDQIFVPEGCKLKNGYLPISLRNLCQRVYVERPNQKTLIYTLLLANNVPQAYNICNVINEILRHVEGKILGEIYLYPKHLKMIISNIQRCLTSDPETIEDLAFVACSNSLKQFIPKSRTSLVKSILFQLLPKEKRMQVTDDDLKDFKTLRILNEVKRILTSKKKNFIEEQLEKILILINHLESNKEKIVVVVGPKQSGKTTLIETACVAMSNLSETFKRHLTHQKKTEDEESDNEKSEIEESEFSEITSPTEEKLIYKLTPHVYDQDQLLGSDKSSGLLPNLLLFLNSLTVKKQRFILLDGPSAGNILQNFNSLPGFLSIETGMVLPVNENCSFVIETERLEDVSEWVRSRASFIQLGLSTITPGGLLDVHQPTLAIDSTLMGESDQKSVVAESFSLENTDDEGAMTPRMKSKELFSIDSNLTSQSTLFYLLQPFLDIELSCWTMIPVSAITLVEQSTSFLRGLSQFDKNCSVIGRSIDYSDIGLELEENDVNFVYVISAAISTLTSLLSAEYKHVIEERLRPRIENISIHNFVTPGYKKVIDDLLTTDANLSNISWNLYEKKWEVVNPQNPSTSKTISKTTTKSSSHDSTIEGEEVVKDGEGGAEEVIEEKETPKEKDVTTLISEIKSEIIIDPEELEVDKLRNILTPLIHSKRSLLVIGRKFNRKTHCVLSAVKQITNDTIIHIQLTKMTSVQDFENCLMKFLKLTAIDVLEPEKPTIVVINNLQFLKKNLSLLSYIQNLCDGRGIYHPHCHYTWTKVINMYIVGVMSVPSKSTQEEKQFWSEFRCWFIHTFAMEKLTTKTGMLLLNFHMHNVELATWLKKATLSILLEMKSIKNTTTEIKLQMGVYSMLHRIASTFEVLRQSFITLTEHSTETAEGFGDERNSFQVWLFAICLEAYYPIIDLKKRISFLDVIKDIIISDQNLKSYFTDFELPKPVWLKKSEKSFSSFDVHAKNKHDLCVNFQSTWNNCIEMTKKEKCWQESGAPQELDHAEMFTNFTLIISSILIDFDNAESSPLLLVVGIPSPDVSMLVEMAAKYLDFSFLHCKTSEEVMQYLQLHFSDDVIADATTFLSQTPILLFNGNLLKDRGVLKMVYEIVSRNDMSKHRLNRNKASIIVTSTEEEVSGESYDDFSYLLAKSRILRLDSFTVEQHSEFGRKILSKTKEESDHLEQMEDSISEFLGHVHHSVLKFEPKCERGKMDPRMMFLDSFHPLPSVRAIKNVIEVFLYNLRTKRESIGSELRTLKTTINRDEALQQHLEGVKAKDANIAIDAEKTSKLIKSIEETVQMNKSKISAKERLLESLHEELFVAGKSEKDLSDEVAEYEKETKSPLISACNELEGIDMDRVKKLVSRSPLTAVQVVFECAVTFLGSVDTTWKAVRQSTNNPLFCSKLAALDVPSISKEQIEAVVEKLKQVKITEDHMARMSDIGSVLLRYLKTAVFLWRRYHEDVKPRQERVDSLRDVTEKIAQKISEVEKSVAEIRKEIKELVARSQCEEEKLVLLRIEKKQSEEELTRVERVIQELKPHTESWKNKIAAVESQLEYLPGNCLLEGACQGYLAPIPSQIRREFLNQWQKLLINCQVLANSPYVDKGLRVVSSLPELHDKLRRIIEQRTQSASFLIAIRDPHCMEDIYFEKGPTIYLESPTWKDTLRTVASTQPECLVHLRGHHDLALQFITWKSYNLTNNESSAGFPSIVLSLEDSCSYQPCSICSTQTMINLSLNEESIEFEFGRTFLQNLGRNGLEMADQIQGILKNLQRVKAKRKKISDYLKICLIEAEDLKSQTILDELSEEAHKLSEVISEETKVKKDLEILASEIQAISQNAAEYAGRVYYSLNLLRHLSEDYVLQFDYLKEAFAVATNEAFTDANERLDTKEKSEKLKEIISDVVTKLLNSKLANHHRIPVGVIFSILKVADNVDYKNLLKGFLEPVDETEDIWKSLLDLELQEGRNMLKKEDSKDENNELVESLLTKLSFEEEESKVNEINIEDVPLQSILGQCSENLRVKLATVMNACLALLKNQTEFLTKNLLQYIDGKMDAIGNEEDQLNIVLEVIIARHFRKDIFLRKSESLMLLTSNTGYLCPPDCPLERNFTQCNFLTSPRFKKQKLLMKVMYNWSLRSDLIIKLAASNLNVKQYKVTNIFVPSLTTSDLRHQILKASRRKTWLIVHDCEMRSSSLLTLHRILNSIPDDADPPTLLYLSPTSTNALDSASEFVGVSLRVEGPVNFQTSLLQFLPKVISTNKSAEDLQVYPVTVKAVYKAVAFVHAVFCARNRYKRFGWTGKTCLTEGDFLTALELVSFYFPNNPKIQISSWETVTESLIQVIYRNCIPNKLDITYAKSLINGYLSSKVLDAVNSNLEIENSFESQQYKLFKQLCAGKGNDNDQKVLQELYTQEEAILGLNHFEYEDNYRTLILSSLQYYEESHYVSIPMSLVKAMVRLLIINTRETLWKYNEDVERQRDLETSAWEDEVKEWDNICTNTHQQIVQLLQAGAERNFSPSKLVVTVENIIDKLLLPQNKLKWLRTGRRNECMQHLTRKNYLPKDYITNIAQKIFNLFNQLQQRFKQLQYWVLHETPPAVVYLGVFAFPQWWLSQFRRAACSRAHWNLRSSQFHSIPALNVSIKSERPSQGIYLTGLSLVGGLWNGESIFQANSGIEPKKLSLCLMVGHSKPAALSGQKWIPVMNTDNQTVLFESLMPIDPSFTQPRDMIHIKIGLIDCSYNKGCH